MEWWDIVLFVVTIVAVGFAIFLGLRTRQVYRPAVVFNVGLLSTNDEVRKTLKKGTVATLIYGADIPRGDEVGFAVPYTLMNHSKLPVHNLAVQLHYSPKYVVRNEDRVSGVIMRGEEALVAEFGGLPEAEKVREVEILGSMAQVRYSIPMIRPGERVVIPDPMRFANNRHIGQSCGADYGISEGLAQELRKTNKVSDFCVVDVFIYSESCPPQTCRVKLLWFDTNSADELSSLMMDALPVFWGGHFPEPGLYFHLWLPWKKEKELLVEEHAEATVASLERMRTSEGTCLWCEDPLKSGRNIFTLKMPPWNYYQAPRSLSTDELLQKTGFGSVVSGDRYKKLSAIFKAFRRQ